MISAMGILHWGALLPKRVTSAVLCQSRQDHRPPLLKRQRAILRGEGVSLTRSALSTVCEALRCYARVCLFVCSNARGCCKGVQNSDVSSARMKYLLPKACCLICAILATACLIVRATMIKENLLHAIFRIPAEAWCGYSRSFLD
jgi:hypothetical protein